MRARVSRPKSTRTNERTNERSRTVRRRVTRRTTRVESSIIASSSSHRPEWINTRDGDEWAMMVVRGRTLWEQRPVRDDLDVQNVESQVKTYQSTRKCTHVSLFFFRRLATAAATNARECTRECTHRARRDATVGGMKTDDDERRRRRDERTNERTNERDGLFFRRRVVASSRLASAPEATARTSRNARGRLVAEGLFIHP